MERIQYGGWENCYRLANGHLEVVLTGDVGPRVIRLAPAGGRNLFKEFPDMMGLSGGDEWRIYGGHRLWHAPESRPRTYHPDNDPVQVEQIDRGMKAIQKVESSTGIGKEMDVHVSDSAPCVKIVHRLRNHNLWPVTLSVWALSVMAPGGTALIPQPPFRSHEEALTPSHPLVLWPYTTMNDERWDWGARFIRLRQDSGAATPQKIGTALPEGTAYYALEEYLFVKHWRHVPGALYPDLGSSFEAFTNSEMLEMESLSPLSELAPGGAVEHTEYWLVLKDIDVSGPDSRTQEALESVREQIAGIVQTL